MEFRILGPLEALHDGRPVPLGGPQQRALLAILLLHAGEVISTDRLVDELLGERAGPGAATRLEVEVTALRKGLAAIGDGRRRVVTRASGYVLELGADGLDLARFERLVADACQSRSPERSAQKLREALALWRGSPLAEFAAEPFAQCAIVRLEELRLLALEERIDADLASGRESEVISELDTLTAAHPLRERLRGQLMLALYRSGRQAEALDVYQQARRTLVDELGIDPGPALQRLEQAILRQDAALERAAPRTDAVPASAWRPARSILVSADTEPGLEAALSLAEPLARCEPPHELIVARVLPPGAGVGRELARASVILNMHRDRLASTAAPARVAAFTAVDPGVDLACLARAQDVDLLLLAMGQDAVEAPEMGEPAATVLGGAPCDVGLLVVGGAESSIGAGPVLVPFGGTEHDWAALELGAWLSRARGVSLRLLGRDAAAGGTAPDAGRSIACAGLAVRQLAGVASEPVLASPGPDGVVEASRSAGLIVLGLPDAWRRGGVGEAGVSIIRWARVPVVLVRRGLRPGAMTPPAALTRFTWSLAGSRG